MKFSSVLIVLFLLVVPVISAQPTSIQTNLNAEVGIGLQFPQLFHLPQNTNFTFSFHAFNKSSGVLKTNDTIACEFHLYSIGNKGKHLVSVSSIEYEIDDMEFEITVDKGNFTKMGHYSYIVQCNETLFGGFDAVGFEVTADGFPSKTFPTQFLIILFALILVVLGLLEERWRMFKYMGSLLMMVMGVLTLYPGYSFINWTTMEGLALGSILIALGFYFLIEDSFSRGEQTEYYQQESKF